MHCCYSMVKQASALVAFGRGCLSFASKVCETCTQRKYLSIMHQHCFARRPRTSLGEGSYTQYSLQHKPEKDTSHNVSHPTSATAGATTRAPQHDLRRARRVHRAQSRSRRDDQGPPRRYRLPTRTDGDLSAAALRGLASPCQCWSRPGAHVPYQHDNPQLRTDLPARRIHREATSCTERH